MKERPPELWRRVLQAVPEDRAVAVRDVRRAVTGVRAWQLRHLLDYLTLAGLLRKDGQRFRRVLPSSMLQAEKSWPELTAWRRSVGA